MAAPDVPDQKPKLPLAKLAIGAVLLLAIGVAVLKGVDLAALKEQGMGFVRSMGPVAFFTAMAILPAIGMPMTFFTIPAGDAFGAQLGMGTVIALALAVLVVNLALSYWIARYALRPLFTKLLDRYGYKVPRVTKENALAVTLATRLTPGLPYVVQGCILGVAEVPFLLYMLVSWPAQAAYAAGFIVLGEGLLKGNFYLALKGIGAIVVVIVAVQIIRKKMAKRETA